jgi:hypothetical protein
MPVGCDPHVKDLAESLGFTERYIRNLATAAKKRSDRVEWLALRDPSTGEPLTDKDGWAYVVVTSPPTRRGRPKITAGEHCWTFRRVEPTEPVVFTPEPVVFTPEPVVFTPEPVVTTQEPRVTTEQRYLLPGSPLGRDQRIILAIAAAAGIMSADPVRVLIGAREGEPMQVKAADGPGPVLGMALRPEGWTGSWQTNMGDRVEVLVRGALLLPTAGPIGMGPGFDRLLWDPEAHSWCGEPMEGRRLLELFGSAGLDHSSDGSEPAVALINGDLGLRLDWVHNPEP